MVGTGRVKEDKINIGVLNNGSDITAHENAGILAAQKRGVKNMFFLDTGLSFVAAGHMKNSRIDEAAFALMEGIGVMGKVVIHGAAAQIEEFHFIVPVPGEDTAGAGVKEA